MIILFSLTMKTEKPKRHLYPIEIKIKNVFSKNYKIKNTSYFNYLQVKCINMKEKTINLKLK
jgi:hypothetical protein